MNSKIIVASILVMLSSLKGYSAQYIPNSGLFNSMINLNNVSIIERDGATTNIRASLVALDNLPIHGGQIYQVSSTDAARDNLDSTFAKGEGKLIIPLLIQNDNISYNLSLINTNGVTANVPLQFTIVALSMSSYAAGSDTKIIFIEGPRGAKGDKGEKGDKGDSGMVVPPITNPPVVVPPQPPVATYNIGDHGPAGGIIFYVDATGDHGLEAQLTDLAPKSGIPWQDSIDEAIRSDFGGKRDWRLPNKEELNKIHLIRNLPIWSQSFILSNDSLKNYWTNASSATDTRFAWYQSFGDGSQLLLIKTYKIGCFARAIRNF